MMNIVMPRGPNRCCNSLSINITRPQKISLSVVPHTLTNNEAYTTARNHWLNSEAPIEEVPYAAADSSAMLSKIPLGMPLTD